jgi:hypothetical protein
MKFKWVNRLATLLILGGVGLLVERHFHGPPKKHMPTIEAAKVDIQRQIEVKLGRPLSDAEVEMIDVTKSGEQISITLHQPLTGRLMQAIHDAKAATQASSLRPPNLPTPSPNGTDLMNPLRGDAAHLAGSPTIPLPTTAPLP